MAGSLAMRIFTVGFHPHDGVHLRIFGSGNSDGGSVKSTALTHRSEGEAGRGEARGLAEFVEDKGTLHPVIV